MSDENIKFLWIITNSEKYCQMKTYTRQFLKLFCKDSSGESNKTLQYCFHFTLTIINHIQVTRYVPSYYVAHHKLDDQTYALERVEIYRQSFISINIARIPEC